MPPDETMQVFDVEAVERAARFEMPDEEGAELRAVMRLTTFVAVQHQPGLFEDAQMLGNGRLRDARPRRQRPDRLFAVAAQPLEDGPPGRVGKRFEEHVLGVGH